MPNESFNTFASGARQLVVQLAFEMIRCGLAVLVHADATV
jgi:hypothetical protein